MLESRYKDTPTHVLYGLSPYEYTVAHEFNDCKRAYNTHGDTGYSAYEAVEDFEEMEGE